MSRQAPVDQRQLFYNQFADEFDSCMNMYDTTRRVEVVFDQLLPPDLTGKQLLDAGCGTGWFSKAAVERGAVVTSLDVGENLLEKVARKCSSTRVVGDICHLQFDDATFDVVVSSEVIEHVPDPTLAIAELARVLKPGGLLALTTPNRIWHFAITLANKLGARPYQGYENWLSYRAFAYEITRHGLVIDQHFGFHLVPFIHPILNPFLRGCDRFGKVLGPIMLNQAIAAHKPAL